jgi:hypothetical protein
MLSGCDSSSDSTTSSFNLAVTDAPTDGAVAVVIEFTGIELKPREGQPFSIDLAEPASINLLNFQGTDSAALFTNEEIPAGNYNWLRLKVNAERTVIDSYIDFVDGNRFPLYIPSGSSRGLQWNAGFVAPSNGSVDFTLDFDVKKSVHSPGNSTDDYFLRPVIRVVDNTVVGHISGSVDATLFEGETCGDSTMVYLFDVNDTPDDIGSATPPQTQANVSETENGLSYTFGYVLPGDYNLALTCQASDDMPDTDDNIEFIAEVPVAVVRDQTAVANF